jgi:hypothetical protein
LLISLSRAEWFDGANIGLGGGFGQGGGWSLLSVFGHQLPDAFRHFGNLLGRIGAAGGFVVESGFLLAVNAVGRIGQDDVFFVLEFSGIYKIYKCKNRIFLCLLIA